jgi:hypothetical protein
MKTYTVLIIKLHKADVNKKPFFCLFVLSVQLIVGLIALLTVLRVILDYMRKAYTLEKLAEMQTRH